MLVAGAAGGAVMGWRGPIPTRAQFEKSRYCCAHVAVDDENLDLYTIGYCAGVAGERNCEACLVVTAYLRHVWDDALDEEQAERRCREWVRRVKDGAE